MSGFSPGWLRQREPADAAARATGLLAPLRDRQITVVHDLGCGTGAMARWLAGQLPEVRHWVLYDRDPVLLRAAMSDLPPGTTGETRPGDISGLTGADLAGADLVTASALLDLLTPEQVGRLAAAVVAAGCPALYTLSVLGEVRLDPADPLDAEITAAFNAHQRRGGRLGPDAVDRTAAEFAERGAQVSVAPSPWRLVAGELLATWLAGWVGAAVQQRPALADPARAYLRRRLADRSLHAVVHHADLLVAPD